VISRTPLLLTRCRRDRRYVFVNQACADFFSRPAHDIVGRSIPEVMGEAAYTTIEPKIELVLLGENVEFEMEIPYAHAGARYMRALYTPDRDERGDVIGWVATIIDITERKRAEAALIEAKSEAERANRAKDEFLAMLSHELRTPLSSILGWAAILRSGLPFERAGHALEVIERNARVEVQLVESLLDLSRVVAGKMKLDMERVDLSSAVEAVADSIRPSADAKAIVLDVAVPPNPLVIIGDNGRLQQILSNLVSNAVKFTPRGGRVQLRLAHLGSQAQIQVSDNGEGISADFLPYIFDRFRQAENAKARAHGGLGLGLAIVQELAHAHGGTVVANSMGKGCGSTFTLTLPIPAVIPANIATTTVQIAPKEPSISRLRVLVVDDDADARELVALTLESRGAIVQAASAAKEALDLITRQKFDVLIADIGMPEEDGYVLIQRLRALERQHLQKRLPAIALTAYASETDRDQALAAGFDLHLTKPVRPNELTLAVAMFPRAREREV
jgi:PAS domain S-box-containing protein